MKIAIRVGRDMKMGTQEVRSRGIEQILSKFLGETSLLRFKEEPPVWTVSALRRQTQVQTFISPTIARIIRESSEQILV